MNYDNAPYRGWQGAQDAAQGSTTASEPTNQTDKEHATRTPWSTDYTEASLLRGLLHARYADVLTMCADRPVQALQGDPRRLILTVLVRTAQSAVDADNGQLPVAPSAVLARLQAMSGPVALDAVTNYLPEALAGEVRGTHAITPAVHEVPLLWDSVELAYFHREVESHGHALVAAAENGDPSILAAEVQRGDRLRALAARVSITPINTTTRPQIVTEGSVA